MNIVLASASPRRKALLEEAGLRFTIEPANIDERVQTPAGMPPAGSLEEAEALALLLAERKALHVAEHPPGPDRWILGSDTVVAVPLSPGAGPDRALTWRLLGKPENPGEAREMLELLSGTRHRVVTGVCVVRSGDGERLSSAETTWVSMRPITAAEMNAYVDSGEWRDKAGGYAIQENADVFVELLEGGGFDNVVGLPVALTLGLLGRLGAPGLPEALADQDEER